MSCFYAVIRAWNEPFAGWVDNCNGPVGLMIARGKVFLHKLFADPDATADIFIKFLLLAAWCKAVGR